MRLWEDNIPGCEPDSPGHIPSMTPYLVPGSKLCGAILVFPGGGYANRADHEGEPIAQWLNQIGLSAFVVHYRTAPVKHPYPLMDAKRAIRLVRYYAAEWNLDPERIGVLGFSAGGHLVSTACTHFDYGDPESEDPIERISSRPDASVLCYPVISMGEYRHHGSMANLIGEEPDESLRKSLCSERMVNEQTPPAFLWHTADDGAVPVENSLMYASALSRNKVPFELHVFPHGRHGLGLAEGEAGSSQWTALCAEWLREIGFRDANII